MHQSLTIPAVQTWKPMIVASAFAILSLAFIPHTSAQLIDQTLSSNLAGEGIAKSLADQVGSGRGDIYQKGSSAFIIARDPFRSIRRGRQLF